MATVNRRTQEETVGILQDVVMGVPVDPKWNADPEFVRSLRDSVEEMMAQGIMPDVPFDVTDFPATDEEPDWGDPNVGKTTD